MSIVALLIVSCSSDSNNESIQQPEPENDDIEFVDSFDRSLMLTEWADKIIIPNYDLFVDKLNFYNNNTEVIFEELRLKIYILIGK